MVAPRNSNAWLNRTTLYVDGTAPNNTGDGSISGPIRDWEEVMQRLGKGTVVPNAALTITVVTPPADPIVIDDWLALNGNITVTGTWGTPSRTGTISAVTQLNAATNTPYEIQDSGFATAAFVGQLIKITGGNAGARTGNYMALAKDTSGGGVAKMRITTPFLSDSALSTTPVVLAVNDTYAIQNQASISVPLIRTHCDPRYAVILQDLHINNSPAYTNIYGDGLVLQRCQIDGVNSISMYMRAAVAATFYGCSVNKYTYALHSWGTWYGGGFIGTSGVEAAYQPYAHSHASFLNDTLFQYARVGMIINSSTQISSLGFMDSLAGPVSPLQFGQSSSGLLQAGGRIWGSVGTTQAVQLTEQASFTFAASDLATLTVVGTAGATQSVLMDGGIICGWSDASPNGGRGKVDDGLGNRLVAR